MPRHRDQWEGTNNSSNAKGISTDGSLYTEAEVEFMLAMERYKREKGRRFPNWKEVLEVAKSLGYRKVTGGGGECGSSL